MKTTQGKKVALVAGASGIVGQQLIQALVADQWQVTALTHRADLAVSGTGVIAVDLRDVQKSHERLASLTDVTHIFYSAWLSCWPIIPLAPATSATFLSCVIFMIITLLSEKPHSHLRFILIKSP